MNETLSIHGSPKPAGTSKKHDLLPDFLIIGAGKSGTTSLDKYLKQHPEIFIPAIKEPNFFGYEHIRIEDLASDPAEMRHYEGSVTNFEEYVRLFNNAGPKQVKGETSNTYMYHPQAPERIHHYIPDVKLIAILRQPANRLYSRYLHLARDNRTPTENFSDCLNRDNIWWKRNDLVREGFYFRNLSPFYKLFPAENIRIYLYEELNNQPAQVLEDIYRFLGVEPGFRADLSVKYNQSGIVKNKFLDKIYGRQGIVNRTMKAILPAPLLHKVTNSLVIQRTVNDLRSKNLFRPRMDPDIKSRLTNDVYGDDIRKLQKLIGKDLRHWLK